MRIIIVLLVLVIIGSDIGANTRRSILRLFFTAHPILEMPFVSVWPMFRICVKDERGDMPVTYPTLEVPFASMRPIFRAYMKGEKGDIPFVSVFTAHPTCEMPFASAWLIFRASAMRFGGES